MSKEAYLTYSYRSHTQNSVIFFDITLIDMVLIVKLVARQSIQTMAFFRKRDRFILSIEHLAENKSIHFFRGELSAIQEVEQNFGIPVLSIINTC